MNTSSQNKISISPLSIPSLGGFQEYFGAILKRPIAYGHNFPGLNIEDASIYINPEGFDFVKKNMDENTIYVNQVLAIEHIGLSKYKITYLSENFTKDSVLPTVLPTKIIGSLYEIDDSQLELITLCWPGMKGNVGKLNFRNTLNSACEIIDSQLKPKPLADRTIENTGHAININLATH